MPDAPAPVTPAKSPMSTFILLLTFLVVAFVIFDPSMRALLGNAVGFVFDPLFGFGGRHPLWTVALAGVVMILASTVIRHFLVDWVKMARVQEVMRHFQKEFRAAQKENNTYRMKRLTEAQPEIMQLQADMSGEQLKPMAFTMLVVIPIFMWLSTFMAAPVVYDVELAGSGALALVAFGNDLYDAEVVRAGEEGADLALVQNAHVHAFALDDASGTVTFESVTDDRSFAVGDLPAVPEGKTVELAAGSYAVRTVDNLDMWDPEDPAKINRAVLLVEQGGQVVRALVATPQGATLELDEAATVRVIAVAPPNAEPRGLNPLQVHIGDQRVDFAAEDVFLFPTSEGQVTLLPKAIRVPWNPTWDLNESWWILPRWILLYSLISIPLGTIVQKILKKWEFSRVDLDRDGVPAGRNL